MSIPCNCGTVISILMNFSVFGFLIGMKFGNSLSNQIDETLPEWRDKFLSYKELKKKLKLIEPKGPSSSSEEEGRAKKEHKVDSVLADGREAMTEANFVKLLEDELEKFNAFFVEKEEECIITLKVVDEWPGLPTGVKFDPFDIELLEHLATKVGVGKSKLHAFIDDFFPTLEGDEGICYTHPENLPG